jgi:hypothetical protein
MIIEETAFSLDTGSGSFVTLPLMTRPTEDVMVRADATVASSVSKSSWTTVTREGRLDATRFMAEEDWQRDRDKHRTRKTPKRRSAKASSDDAILENHDQPQDEDIYQEATQSLPEETQVEMKHSHDANSRGRARHRRRSLKFTEEEEQEHQPNKEDAHQRSTEQPEKSQGEMDHIHDEHSRGRARHRRRSLKLADDGGGGEGHASDDMDHPMASGAPVNVIDPSGRIVATAIGQNGLQFSQSGNEISGIEPIEGGSTGGQDDQVQNLATSERGESHVVRSLPETTSQTPQSEDHHTPAHHDNGTITPIPENPKPKLVGAPAPDTITPTDESQNLRNGQPRDLTPNTARTSNRKVGSKSPRRFGGPENLPLVSPKLITRRIQGTSRQSPRVHRLRVTPKAAGKESVPRPSALPPRGRPSPHDPSGSFTPGNARKSTTSNVPGMPPFATDMDYDAKLKTQSDDAPLSFPDESNPELLRLCNRLRKKLNLDPWDEFKGFDDVEFTDFVQIYPQTCRVRYTFDNFTGKLLPLPIVCTMGANVETVRATFEAYPQALSECDDWIGTPLHYACSYQAKKSVVKFLIQRNSSMLEQINQFGRTPLHMACLFKAPVQTIQPLLEVFPHAVEILDKDGYSPLHLACENGSSLEVIQALLEVSPQENGLIGTSEKDLTPLHIACASNAPKAVIQALLNHCPDATDQLDHDGQLPLHHAVHASVPQAVIELLVQTFPQSVEIPNARGQTAYRIAKRKHMPTAVLEILDEEVD